MTNDKPHLYEWTEHSWLNDDLISGREEGHHAQDAKGEVKQPGV